MFFSIVFPYDMELPVHLESELKTALQARRAPRALQLRTTESKTAGENHMARTSRAVVLRAPEPTVALAPATKTPTGRKKIALVRPEKTLTLPPLTIQRLTLEIVETSPLIIHRMSEKAKKMMRDKKEGRAQGKREPCDPEKEYLDARYLDEEGKDAFPALAMKRAIVDAASFAEGVTKVELRGALFILGDWIVIKFKKRERREDPVRVGNGAADLRYRPCYHGWRASVPVEFNTHVVSEEQVYHLFDLAGFSVGIGDWRPQRNGQFGRFEVVKGLQK